MSNSSLADSDKLVIIDGETNVNLSFIQIDGNKFSTGFPTMTSKMDKHASSIHVSS